MDGKFYPHPPYSPGLAPSDYHLFRSMPIVSDEHNRLLLENVRNIVVTQYNYKKMSCGDFHKYLMKTKNVQLLRAVGDAEKYENTNK